MDNVTRALPVGISDLSLDEILAVGGGLSANQIGNIGNAAFSLGGAAAMVGAEPVAAFLVGFGIGAHLVAAMAE